MSQLDLLITFDTTGSMYPCLTQVRRGVVDTVRKMFASIDDLRVAVIAHGDYCDKGSTYVTKAFNFSNDQHNICQFIQDVGPTGGGDSPECYELVLHEARSLSWGAGRKKILLMIGDDVPHQVGEAQNYKKLDWRNELKLLVEADIKVYGVHAMPGIRRHSQHFYAEMASITGGLYLTLDQFDYITDLLRGVVAQQAGGEALSFLEQEMRASGRLNRSSQRIVDTLSGKTTVYVEATGDLEVVPAGRFQMINVGGRDMPIKDCCAANGLTFRKGRGFYEWTKTETIQDYKEVVLMDRKTGDFFSGKKAREMCRLPAYGNAQSRPPNLSQYVSFIQSTSNNRNLKAGTRFLYEVEDR